MKVEKKVCVVGDGARLRQECMNVLSIGSVYRAMMVRSPLPLTFVRPRELSVLVVVGSQSRTLLSRGWPGNVVRSGRVMDPIQHYRTNTQDQNVGLSLHCRQSTSQCNA
jgi:hypothetical protein